MSQSGWRAGPITWAKGKWFEFPCQFQRLPWKTYWLKVAVANAIYGLDGGADSVQWARPLASKTATVLGNGGSKQRQPSYHKYHQMIYYSHFLPIFIGKMTAVVDYTWGQGNKSVHLIEYFPDNSIKPSRHGNPSTYSAAATKLIHPWIQL